MCSSGIFMVKKDWLKITDKDKVKRVFDSQVDVDTSSTHMGFDIFHYESEQ